MKSQIPDDCPITPPALSMLRSVSLPDGFTRGNLFLCSMPGRFECLEVFLQAIADSKIGHVLCLVSDEEIARKSPDYLEAIRQDRIPAKLWRHDITDYGIPKDPEGLGRTLDLVSSRLVDGESVVIHCAAGHGRTGVASTMLLARMGMPLDQAVDTIRRAGSGPDTPEQRRFLDDQF